MLSFTPQGTDLSNYLYLPGRAGGQVAYGGTASGDNLILHSGTVENGYISLGDLDAIKGIRYSEGTGQLVVGKYPVGFGSDYYKLIVVDDQSLAGGFGYVDDQGNQVAGIQIFQSAGTNYPYIQFGDIGGVANQTTFTLNDAQKQIYFYADNYIYFGNNAGNFLIEVQPLSNTVRFYGGVGVGTMYLDSLRIKAISTTQTSQIIEAVASQTSKLSTWQNTSHSVLSYVDTAGVFGSNVATGTAPFIISSTTKVANLNVDLLDDRSESEFLLLAGRSGGQIAYGSDTSTEGLVLRSNTSFDGFVDIGDVLSDPAKFIRFDELTGNTGFGIIPTNAQVEIKANSRDDMSVFRIKDNDGNKIFDNQLLSRYVYAQLGDIDNVYNGTVLTVDDSGSTITLNADTQVQIITGVNTAVFSNTGLYFTSQTDINLNNGALTASAAVLTEFLQSDLITNGTFTGGTTGWTLGTGWAYGTNNVTKNADGTGTLAPSTPLTISAGSPYKLEFVISSLTVGSVTVSLGGTTVGTYTANGSYVEYVIASGTGNLIFNPTNTSRFTVDTVALHILQPHLQASGTHMPLRVQKISSHPYSDEYMFNLSHVISKATSGNDTTFLINNVDTASPGSSFFEEFRLNGVAQWKITATGLVSMMNGISTVSNGVPVEYAKSDLTAQSAAIAATTLYAVPSTGAGMYRVSWVATITTAASTSSVLGGTNGFQLKYTDPTDSVVKTTAAPIITSAANTTGTSISGVLVAYCKASTNLQYTMDYTSVGGTSMVYDMNIKVEAL